MKNVSEYCLYDHPILPPRLVKSGFCWPALIVGPAWLLFRRLWVPTLGLLALGAAAYYLNHHNLSDTYVLNACFYMEDYREWVAIAGSGISERDCVIRTRSIDFVIMALAQIVTASYVNRLWAMDLVNRGYVLTKSVQARSIDDARAILARETELLMPHSK